MEGAGAKRAVRVAAAVIERGGRVLVARRKAGGLGGDWEFPGGKVEDGEAPEAALARELAEELGVAAETGEALGTVEYRGAGAIDLLVYRAELASDDFTLTDHEEVRWLRPADLDEAVFSEPDRPVVRRLRNGRD